MFITHFFVFADLSQLSWISSCDCENSNVTVACNSKNETSLMISKIDEDESADILPNFTWYREQMKSNVSRKVRVIGYSDMLE